METETQAAPILGWYDVTLTRYNEQKVVRIEAWSEAEALKKCCADEWCQATAEFVRPLKYPPKYRRRVVEKE